MLPVTNHPLGKRCLWNANPQRPKHRLGRPPQLKAEAGYLPDLAFLADV